MNFRGTALSGASFGQRIQYFLCTTKECRNMKKITTKKMALTAMLACLAFVLNTFVYFPAMAPFQHFVDVLAAVLVGPWYGFAASLLCESCG